MYMKDFELKYGFFTTYNSTIFLKQEYLNNEWVLYISLPIKHDTRSVHISSQENLRDKVSLRECFLYFMKLSSAPDYRAPNNTPSGKWSLPGKVHGTNLGEYRNPPSHPQETLLHSRNDPRSGLGNNPTGRVEDRDNYTGDKRDR